MYDLCQDSAVCPGRAREALGLSVPARPLLEMPVVFLGNIFRRWWLIFLGRLVLLNFSYVNRPQQNELK